MKKTQKAALAISALLLLGAAIVALLWPGASAAVGGREPIAPSPPAAVAAAPRHPRTRADDAATAATADAEATTVPSAPPAPPEPSAKLRDLVVRVVDAQHQPRAWILVHLDVMSDVRQATVAPSGDDGRAKFRVAGEIRSASVDQVAADGHAWRQRGRPVRIAPDAAEVEIVVERWEPIRGRVVGDDGRPICGLGVIAVADGRTFAETKSDADGRFSFPADRVCDVAVTGWEFPPGEPPVAEARAVAPGCDPLTLVARAVAETRALDVRTVTSDGRPLGDVPVRVMPPVGWTSIAAGRTDQDGLAAFAAIPDRLVRVEVGKDFGATAPWEAAGWIAPPAPRLVRPGGADVTIVFEAGRPIRGRVEFPANFPSVAAIGDDGRRVFVLVQDEDGNVLSSATSDTNQRFCVLVPASSAGPLRISCGLRDGSGQRFEGETVTVLPGAQDVVLKITETKR